MKRFLFLTCAAVSVCVGGTAKAGFEWVPPAQAEPQAAPVFAQQVAAPAPEVQVVSTKPNEAAVTGMVPMPPEPARNDVQDIKVASAPRELAPVAPRPSNPDMVEGFGRDVPLTIATRQVVPSDFTVQYGRGVDPNTAVTWKGGRGWKVVLADALAEKDLKATIVADSVMIENTAPEQKLKAEPIATDPVEPEPVSLPPVEDNVVVQEKMMPDMVAPMPPVNEVESLMSAKKMWVAPQATTLRQVLSDWSKEAGVQLQWSAQYDYPLMSEAQISGTFEDAVEMLLDGLVDAQPRPVARLHPNEPNGPAILVVETRQILE